MITAGKDDADQIERDMKRIQSKLISEEEHYTESDLSAQDYSLNSASGAAISSVEDHPSVWSWKFVSQVWDDGGFGGDDEP